MGIKERHKARHAIRDRRAGGVGLGILETKSKHFKAASSASASAPSPSHASPPSTTRCQLSPPVTESQDPDPSRRTSNVSDSVPFLSHQPSEHWSSPPELQGSELTTDYLNSKLNYPNTSQMANMYMDQSPGSYEIGNMYHDMAFDLVHFNVTGFAPHLHDHRPSAAQALPNQSVQTSNNGEGQLLSLVPPPINNDNLIQHEAEPHFSTVPDVSPDATNVANENVRRDEKMSEDAAEDVIRTPTVESIFSDTRPSSFEDKSSAVASPFPAHATTGSRPSEPHHALQEIQRAHSFGSENYQFLLLTSEKRGEVLEFIADIGPVRPDGTLIDGDSPDFSLENLQTYLDLFLEFFNTSYPLIHVATLDCSPISNAARCNIQRQGCSSTFGLLV
jgi:hypothetical protein